ncbi:VOC family protein [Nonomuraea sp. ATR24]|uniref:VOC family protein n=1 Tax=unclassified Nonomuraea TaxID=2593643 RepID=UPI0033D42D31
MRLRLTHANLWVPDQDEALDFYVGKLGMEVREDVSMPEMNGYRWLTVGPPGQPEVSFILNVPRPPVVDDGTGDQVLELVAKGTAGGFHLETDDCRGAYEQLSGAGVEFVEEPEERPYGIDAMFRDPFGHRFRLVQTFVTR